MNGVIQALLAVLAALSAASGVSQANVNAVQPQAKPAMSAPAAIAVTDIVTPTDSVEIMGTVQNIAGASLVLNNGVTVTLGANVEIKGNLQPGAVVQIEATKQSNGTLLATQIQVGGASDKSQDSVDKNTVQDNSIDTAKVKDTSIDTTKTQDTSIDTIKPQDTSVDTIKPQDKSVDTTKSQGSVDKNNSQSSQDKGSHSQPPSSNDKSNSQSQGSADKSNNQSHDSQDKGGSQPQGPDN